MRNTTAEGYSYESVSTVGGQPPYPAELVARSKNLLNATLHLFGQLGLATDAGARAFAKYPVHAQRATKVAGVVGVEPVDLLTANLCYDLLMGLSVMGCSTLALPGEDGPVLARNMDWFPAEKIAKASCLITEDYGVNAGFVGMLGAVTGMSNRGFCVCLNAAFGGSDPAGYPVLLFLRHVLDSATSYADALAMVRAERLMSGGIITLVGTRNDERAVVERTPTRAVVRPAAADGPLMATNHFRDLAKPEACPRYEYMAQHAGKKPATAILTSRNVLQEITAQHVVLCPATRTAEMFVPSHLLPDDVREEMTPADLLGFLQ
jgi:isopenicillin-N N-acyltransferase-like protein